VRSRRSACTPPSPPDAETATSSAHGRQVDREHEQPQRHHPEPEDGQKPYNPAQNQSDPETNPQAARLRQRDLATRKAKRSCLWSLRFVFVGHLGEAPNTTAARRRSEPRDQAIGRRRVGSPSAGNPLPRAQFQLGAKESPPTQGKGRGSQEKKRGGWLRKPRVVCTITYIKPWRATLDRLKLHSAADLRLHAAAVRAAKSSRC
jgi:hypothetical protein